MGLFSWLKGVTRRQDPHSFPSDRVIVGTIATLIEVHLRDEIEQLIRPECMVVLGKDGRVSMRWPSPSVFAQEIPVSFAFIRDLPAFNGLANMPGTPKVMIEEWIDAMAIEALAEMKRNWHARRVNAGAALRSDETDWPGMT